MVTLKFKKPGEPLEPSWLLMIEFAKWMREVPPEDPREPAKLVHDFLETVE